MEIMAISSNSSDSTLDYNGNKLVGDPSRHMGVRTSAVFAPRLYPNASLYQDRLGTNIGKAQKGGAFFAGITNAIYGNRTMLRAAAALAAAQRAAAAAQPPATAVQQLRLKQAMLNVLWCGTRPFQKSYLY